MNNTIKTAETDVYLTLLQLAEKYPVANAWLCPVAQLAGYHQRQITLRPCAILSIAH